jgi:thymidylate synthase (FAD)
MEKDKLINKEFKCLNSGFIRLVDVMGDDAAIVQAARISYGKGTKSISEDRNLIRYLMRNYHTSPFEMVEFKFHIKLPIFVARQWIRHRTANVNEYSGRYSEMSNEFYIPAPDTIRKQSTNNKQARADEGFDSKYTNEIINKFSTTQNAIFQEYKEFVDNGIAREIARINLPLSIYTEWYWKIDLHNLLHFLKLRLDKHAQYEIRVYAEIIANILKQCVPHTWEAFEDYVLNAVCFSAPELEILKNIINSANINKMNIDNPNIFNNSKLTKREIAELINKLRTIM